MKEKAGREREKKNEDGKKKKLAGAFNTVYLSRVYIIIYIYVQHFIYGYI
jgi:hypothetical protein